MRFRQWAYLPFLLLLFASGLPLTAQASGTANAPSEGTRIGMIIKGAIDVALPNVTSNEDVMAGCAQGPHQHSVVLVGRKDQHRVDAIVRLFGGLCYMVNLTESYEGADFYDTLVYDAQRGETIWNDRVKSGEWFVKFIGEAIDPKRRVEE